MVERRGSRIGRECCELSDHLVEQRRSFWDLRECIEGDKRLLLRLLDGGGRE